MTSAQLSRLWAEMADRARGPSPRDPAAAAALAGVVVAVAWLRPLTSLDSPMRDVAVPARTSPFPVL